MHALVKFMGIAWLIIGCLVITIGYFGVWIKGGFSALIDLLNPFNVANTLAVIITVGPGVCC